MTVATRDDIINALGNSSERILWDKNSIASQVIGSYTSLWLSTGRPSAGAIPTTAALCTQATQGAIKFTNPTAPAKSYLMWHWVLTAVGGTTLEIHDRLGHQGGLSGTVTTAQTVSLDASALSIPADRLGAADFSDLTWWLEWYTATGATAVNATVNVTFVDNTTAALSTIAIPSNTAASRAIPITNLLSGANVGKVIKRVDSVQLSASTLTAGNFGVTVTRQRTTMMCNVPSKAEVFDWARLGLPNIGDSACLMGYIIAGAAATGTIRGQGKIGQV